MDNTRITIAIDGYSACGKSTLARSLARRLGYTYIDSGAMYRAVTYYFLRNDIDYYDEAAVDAALADIRIEFRPMMGGAHTFLNGEDVEEAIRQMEVSQHVSPVAALPTVRRAMVAQQQQMGRNKGIVMDGRDIGTVVFPDAELKIFLTADTDVRIQRRYAELQAKGIDIDEEEVAENLAVRDHIDSTREDSPLRRAPGAVVINNTHLSPDEQVGLAYGLAQAEIETVDEGRA